MQAWPYVLSMRHELKLSISTRQERHILVCILDSIPEAKRPSLQIPAYREKSSQKGKKKEKIWRLGCFSTLRAGFGLELRAPPQRS